MPVVVESIFLAAYGKFKNEGKSRDTSEKLYNLNGPCVEIVVSTAVSKLKNELINEVMFLAT